MKLSTRMLVAVAALLLLSVFVFPLWRYDLGAPQYPEGLAMTIWVNKVGGQLALVNQLNHYIGMRAIDPDSMPELRYMPAIVVALVVSGLMVAIVGRRKWLVAWFLCLSGLGIIGLVDFYLWLRDFGTHLNPEAPITIPPFTPPLFGTNMLANFEVSSFPDIAGWAAFAAGALALLALLLDIRRTRSAA